jgi:hypothetical protein
MVIERGERYGGKGNRKKQRNIMRKTIQILLFIISYAPLYVILSIKSANGKYLTSEGLFIGVGQLCNNNKISLILLGFTVISILSYYVMYKTVLHSAPVKKSVKNKIEDNESHLSYLATYILPFIGLDFTTWQSIASSIVLFFVLGSIYIKTNLILTNPTLTLFGFCISKVETKDEKHIFIIHKGTITKNNEYNCIELINNIYIYKS